MIVSVTVLGSSDGTPGEVVGKKIVEYLEGGRTLRAGRAPGTLVDLPSPSGGTAAYYADSAGVRPGRWALGRSGTVDTAELASYLAGVDPATGEALLSGQGSSRRAQHTQSPEPLPLRDWYSPAEAAQFLGVSPRYVGKQLRKWVVDTALAGRDDVIRMRKDGAFEIAHEFLEDTRAKRKLPRIVAGYDLTFSVPKSVSVLWAAADDATRAAVLDGFDEAVAAGLRYLERHAFAVRVRGGSSLASPVAVADYLHTTSRALEPQLHHHVVVANAATGPDGVVRALDGRTLFHHGKTASYVAAAELRHQLTARLGVTWTAVRNGIAEVDGVAKSAMAAMSTRAKEIDAAVIQSGADSPRGRQVAAWGTRAAKEHSVDFEGLLASWDERLAAAGHGPVERAAVLDHVAAPKIFNEVERARVFTELLRVEGMTAHNPVFDRRHVVQRLAERAEERLSGDAIDALADSFLAERDVVALEAPGTARAALRREDGRRVPLPGEDLYTTTAMLALERRGLEAYARGREAGVGVVPDDVLAAVLAEERFARLSDEQRDFVAALTGSGMRIQAGLGAAGTGKTTALGAAVAAWEAADYRVLGAAVGGTQAVVLGEEAGIEARTVASILRRAYGYGDTSLVDNRTVVLVDEASLVSTKDFVGLARLIEDQGATLRFIGDQAQHGSVEAGGLFAHLVDHHKDDTPGLTTIYRQEGEAMGTVRQAVTELRGGKYAQALERLFRDGRVLEAECRSEAYDHLVRGWYGARQESLEDPMYRRSSMTTEQHVDRRELNRRARELLTKDGTLHGPNICFDGMFFQPGDEVIAKISNRDLRPRGADRAGYVRNGSRGTVLEASDGGLVVRFERWGRVFVPRTYIEAERSSDGEAGLQHSYALTTHAAQGETYAVATSLLSDMSTPEGAYVGATRGRFDLQGAIVRRERSHPDGSDALPILHDHTGILEATVRRLEQAEREKLALSYVATEAEWHSRLGHVAVPHPRP